MSTDAKAGRVEIERWSRALREPLRTARGRVAVRETFLVRLVARDGTAGRGEAAPVPWIDGRDPEEVFAELERWRDERQTPRRPEARAAIETARLDLEARLLDVPLARRLSESAADAVPLSALVSGGEPPSGFRSVKTKVGGEPLEASIERVRDLASRCAPGVVLRLDANRAWSLDEAKRFLDGVAGLPIELVEEPLASPSPGSLASLRAAGVPIAIDESLEAPGDLWRHLEADAIDAVVLKVGRLGGPLAALSLGRAAAAAGVRPVVTDAIESPVGRACALHVAAALPAPAAPVGLGGAFLLEDTLPSPLANVDGPGLGTAAGARDAS